MRAVSHLHSKTTRGRNCTAGEQHLLFESSRVVSERQRGTAKDSVSASLSVGVICKVTSELRLGVLHGRCATFDV